MKKEELEKEKSDIHSAKTVCDQVAQRMTKQDALFNQMANPSAIQAATLHYRHLIRVAEQLQRR